ncbi:MAG: plasmid stabilization protein [Acidobacteriota bacterium]
MATGDKSSYTDKQKRQAEHIEEGYEDLGTPKKEAKSRAWATVNKETGGGKKSGSGRAKETDAISSMKGGRKGGKATAKTRKSPIRRKKSTAAKSSSSGRKTTTRKSPRGKKK